MSEEKYTLKIQKPLKDVFQRYIKDHPELGYKAVSQYLTDIIRREAQRLLELERQEQRGKEKKES